MALDTIIAGGEIHTSRRSFRGEIGVRDGRIAAVAEGGVLPRAPGTVVIDASGMDVIPGCIDVHVHLALPFCGTVSCDDFESGSRAAASGCVTTVLDFAIPAAGETLADAHRAWLAKAEGRSMVDYAWHLAITKPGHVAEIPRMIEAGLPTFKEFMIYESEGWAADDAMIFGALEGVKRHGGMLLIHAESPRVLEMLVRRRHTKEEMRRHGAGLHALTRPNFVEVEAIERAVRWCGVTGGRLYIVHMSTGEGAELVRAAQGRGVPVLAETCVQYLVLDESVFEREDGHLFACCPQVKKAGDAERLWEGVRRGEVCVVSTDTCSFTREQKGMWLGEDGVGDFTKIPMGLPGLDTMVPIMYTRGVRAGRISMNRMVEVCATGPARVMGLEGRKGDIAVGLDADIAIIDPERVVRVSPGKAPMQSRCDWSPYEGWELRGFARTTLVRGEVVVREHEVVGRVGWGRFLERCDPGETG